MRGATIEGTGSQLIQQKSLFTDVNDVSKEK